MEKVKLYNRNTYRTESQPIRLTGDNFKSFAVAAIDSNGVKKAQFNTMRLATSYLKTGNREICRSIMENRFYETKLGKVRFEECEPLKNCKSKFY